jgi:hypothetical protein
LSIKSKRREKKERKKVTFGVRGRKCVQIKDVNMIFIK